MPTAAGAAEPGLTLKTLDGSPLGSIAWQPDRPGSALLHRLLPVLGVLTLGLIGTAALILHQARRAAFLIRASEERAFTEPLTGLPNRSCSATGSSSSSLASGATAVSRRCSTSTSTA